MRNFRIAEVWLIKVSGDEPFAKHPDGHWLIWKSSAGQEQFLFLSSKHACRLQVDRQPTAGFHKKALAKCLFLSLLFESQDLGGQADVRKTTVKMD